MIGNLADDDLASSIGPLDDVVAALDETLPAAGPVDVEEGIVLHDFPAGREIRGRKDAQDLVEGAFGVVDPVDDGIRHFLEVMGRDVGRDADGNPFRAVHEKVREAGRKDGRLEEGVVEGEFHIDRILVDVAEHLPGDGGKTGLGVTVGRGRVAVDRAVVPLEVDERHPHGPRLGHVDHRLIDR